MLAGGCASSPGGAEHPAAAASSARRQHAVELARAYLDRWVDPDGRVVRRDQGGDTVSEGQGYALLLAVAADDRERFRLIWSWTRDHLQRPDGLLAFHWQSGRVVDDQPAADADTQVAWALAEAGRRFADQRLVADARRVALAVVTREVGYDDSGRVTLAAGPWALGPGHPVTVEPGYWTPPAAAALGRLTGDERWKAMASSDTRHLAALTRGGASLPPDWALVGQGAPRAVPAPDGSTPVQHGPDAMRAPVWASCTDEGRALLRRTWPLIAHDASRAPTARTLDARPTRTESAPLSAVSAAAVALSAGHRDTGSALLRTAADLAARFPTYYGDAWAALGSVLLTTGLLARCG